MLRNHNIYPEMSWEKEFSKDKRMKTGLFHLLEPFLGQKIPFFTTFSLFSGLKKVIFYQIEVFFLTISLFYILPIPINHGKIAEFYLFSLHNSKNIVIFSFWHQYLENWFALFLVNVLL